MVAIAPDGTWLAASGEEGLLRIWETAEWKLTTTLPANSDRVSAMAITSDGALLATTDTGESIWIWNASSWQVEAMMRVDNAISACCWIGSRGLVVGSTAGLYAFGGL